MIKTITFFTAFFLIQALSADAQVWLEGGIRYQYGITGLWNDNIVNDADYSQRFGSGSGYGGKLCLNIGESNGLLVEFMSARSRQDWEYTRPTQNSGGTNQLMWRHTDWSVLYRLFSKGNFVEFGPSFSHIRKLRQTDPNLPFTITENDDWYVSKYPSITFGFGSYIIGSNSYALALYVKGSYGMQGIVTKAGDELHYPIPTQTNDYQYQKATTPYYIEIGTEFNFVLGKYARANCGRKVLLFLPDMFHW